MRYSHGLIPPLAPGRYFVPLSKGIAVAARIGGYNPIFQGSYGTLWGSERGLIVECAVFDVLAIIRELANE